MQSENKVVGLRGRAIPTPGVPKEHLITALRDLLNMAETGQLQHFVGTGFTSVGQRLSVLFDDEHPDIYQMTGAIAWLEREVMDRALDRRDTDAV